LIFCHRVCVPDVPELKKRIWMKVIGATKMYQDLKRLF